MNTDQIVLLGLKYSVTAFSKADGHVLWRTDLPVTLSGSDFVTVLSDGDYVFAHTEGRLHCLELATGRILWSNGLSGYGYGIASLCFPNGMAAPDPATMQSQALLGQQTAAAGATA